MYAPFLELAISRNENIELTPIITEIIAFLKKYEEDQLKIMEDGQELFEKEIKQHLTLLDKRFENTIDILQTKRRNKIKKYELLLQKKNKNQEINSMLVDFLSQNDVYKKYSILIDELETLLKTKAKFEEFRNGSDRQEK